MTHMTRTYSGWRKSRLSDPNGGCVEAGRGSDGSVGVRDSKGDPAVILRLTRADWASLLRDVRETAGPHA